MANTAVFGIYSTQEQVATAMERIKNDGFRSTDISILCPDNVGTKDLVLHKNAKTWEDAAKGAVWGGVIGGALGWLTGIGFLAALALEPLLAAGPILALLSGLGAGAVIGGLIGAAIGAGTPEYQAKRYQGRTKKGGILLSIHSDGSAWTKKAKTTLKYTGAEDIGAVRERKGDYGNSDRPGVRLAG